MATKGKQKAASIAAPADDGQTLEDLYTKLDGHIKKNEFKRVVKAADESILSKLRTACLCFCFPFLASFLIFF